MEQSGRSVPKLSVTVSERSETLIGNTETLDGMRKYSVTTSISVPIDFEHEVVAHDALEAASMALERTKKLSGEGLRRWDLRSQPMVLAVEDVETGADVSVPCLVARVTGGAK